MIKLIKSLFAKDETPTDKTPAELFDALRKIEEPLLDVLRAVDQNYNNFKPEQFDEFKDKLLFAYTNTLSRLALLNERYRQKDFPKPAPEEEEEFILSPKQKEEVDEVQQMINKAKELQTNG